MYYSTGDVQYLNAAQAGADHLLGTLSEEKSTGFYSGISGSGTAGIAYFFCTGIQISARSVAGSMSGEGMLRYFSSTGPACS